MINDGHDSWHIRLLIFQYIKRIRSLSSEQDVNEIIQQQWLIHDVSAAEVHFLLHTNGSWTEQEMLPYCCILIYLTTSRRTNLNMYKCVCVKSLNQHKLWIFMKDGRQCIIYHDTHTPHWILKSITCHNCYMLNGAIHIVGKKDFFFSSPFHSIKHLSTEFTFTPVGIALHFVFLQFCCTLCQDTEPLSAAAVTYGHNVHNI